ncbi:hypothetical protein DPMN_182024 [Dreissena polymorpha]|uniref:Uncharacterized protein n=1 Tax=Dreissena polymorpha TaxID=45954 RepID=A0A9D4I275_DREPO|nr:hypothetical protein DPMN_182024 [Dreissena polymorpha]
MGAKASKGTKAPYAGVQAEAPAVAVGDHLTMESVPEENVDPSTSQGEENMLHHVPLAIRKKSMGTENISDERF